MSKISAQIVCDSICNGHRITTMLVTMPRFILAEFNTHRMLSKNSASSRAIPFEKMVKMVDENPFIPIAWQRDHKGMQGTEYLTAPIDIAYAHDLWLEGSKWAIKAAKNLNREANDGRPFITKQLCNRLLEPFMYHTVLVTGTEWENFYHLRCPQYKTDYGIFRSRKDAIKAAGLDHDQRRYDSHKWFEWNKGQAEIHMMALAEAMWDARNESTPKVLQPGEWHMPYAPTDFEMADHLYGKMTSDLATNTKMLQDAQVQVATARCAQTSYTIVGDGEKSMTYEGLIDLHNSLIVRPYANRKGVVFGPDDPIHASPAEHCAQAMTDEEYMRYGHAKPYENPIQASTSQVEYGWCHNLRGFKSYRSMIPNENRR
jgi:hypothetical protein